MNDLLQLVNSDEAEELKIHVGKPPVVVLDDAEHTIEGPPVTPENMEQFLQDIANSRQRRELKECGRVLFIYRFRGVTDFIVCAKLENENIVIEIE